jgi:hypothetical protein
MREVKALAVDCNSKIWIAKGRFVSSMSVSFAPVRQGTGKRCRHSGKTRELCLFHNVPDNRLLWRLSECPFSIRGKHGYVADRTIPEMNRSLLVNEKWQWESLEKGNRQ